MGQFALLFTARYRLGYDGWQAVNQFYDAWIDGDIEFTDDDDDGEQTENSRKERPGAKGGVTIMKSETDHRRDDHERAAQDPEEDDLK